MYLVDPKDHILKVSCDYLYKKCVKNGGVKNGGTWRTLKVPGRRLEDRFIFDVLDVMDDVVLP